MFIRSNRGDLKKSMDELCSFIEHMDQYFKTNWIRTYVKVSDLFKSTCNYIILASTRMNLKPRCSVKRPSFRALNGTNKIE